MSQKKINKFSKKKSKIKQRGGLCFNPDESIKEVYFNILLHYFINNKILEYNEYIGKTDIKQKLFDEIKNRVIADIKKINEDPLLFSEIMTDLFNNCFNESSKENKIQSMSLLKNDRISERIKYNYIEKLIKLLKNFMSDEKKEKLKLLRDKLYSNTQSNEQKAINNSTNIQPKENNLTQQIQPSQPYNELPIEDIKIINADNLLKLFILSEDENEKKDKKQKINKFIETFLTNEEYSNLVQNPKNNFEELIIKKLGNMLREIIIVGDLSESKIVSDDTNIIEDNAVGDYLKSINGKLKTSSKSNNIGIETINPNTIDESNITEGNIDESNITEGNNNNGKKTTKKRKKKGKKKSKKKK